MLRLHIGESFREGGILRSYRIEGPARSYDLYYRLSGDLLPRGDPCGDAAAVAVVFLGMQQREDVHIHASVSPRLLRTLETFQAFWALWKPKKFVQVQISADKEIDGEPVGGGRRAVLAYSGGVDSSFSLLRYHLGLAGRANAELEAAVLIHGFDIPLSQREAYNVAVADARATLAALGIKLSLVETNFREIIIGQWRPVFGAAVASVLHQFATVANVGLLASGGQDYSRPIVPSGSNPITDRLLSSERFGIETDGCDSQRTQKVAFIAKFPEVRDRLRVCWEGPQTGRNCGRCEKCWRTYLNFFGGRKRSGCVSQWNGPLSSYPGSPTRSLGVGAI